MRQVLEWLNRVKKGRPENGDAQTTSGRGVIGALLAAGGLASLCACGLLLWKDASWLAAGLLGGVALLWGGLFVAGIRWSEERFACRWRDFDRQVNLTGRRTKDLLENLAAEFNSQFNNMQNENQQVQSILADAIDKLIKSFTRLEDESRRQQELAVSLTSSGLSAGVGADDGGLTFNSFLVDIEKVLREFVNAINGNSQVAHGLVAKMNEANTRFKGILKLLREVEKIANQTNLLAINAAVEAARAGQAGKGFAVVAEEVRNLSMHSNKFSSEIRDSVNGIAAALTSVEQAINEMVDQDSELIKGAVSQVDGLMDKSRAFNHKVETSAAEISELSEQVAGEVRSAVTSLQFQDLSTQVIAHVNSRIDNLMSVLADLVELPLEDRRTERVAAQGDSRHLVRLNSWLGDASVLVENAKHNPVSQKSMDEGDIELF